MRNTKIRILSFILAAAMLTGCGASAESDSMTESSQNDSSFTDSKSDSESKTDTTDDSKSDSSSDESKSENAATTTKTSESKNESEKAVTTTKQSSTTTSAVATQPVATRPTAKPIVTTKATQKPIVTAKQTTKATVRVTAKQSNNSNVKPSGLTRLEDAVWELSFHGKDTNTMYLNIVRDELIKYGQAYCKSNPACFKLFTINTKLYPYYDKNGKPLYAGCDMKGNVIAVGSNVEFPYDEIDAPFNYSTSQERLQGCRSFINRMKLLIERVLCNALNHGIANMEWYITYGFEAAGTDWVVMAHIPDGEWVEF